jgi:hypothetical protein
VQVLATGKLFLSALAVISAEELESLRPTLLPHKIKLDCDPSIQIFRSSKSPSLPAINTLADNLSLLNEEPQDIMEVDSNLAITVGSPRQSTGDGPTNDQDLNVRRIDSETSQSCNSASENFIPPLREIGEGHLSSPHSILRLESNSVGTDFRNSILADIDRSASKRLRDVIEPSTFSELMGVTKRARTVLDTTLVQSMSHTHSQSRGTSLVRNENIESVEPDSRSHYLRSYEIISSRFGEDTEYNLKPSQVIEVIKTGDSFLRDDSMEFITSYLDNYHDRLSQPPRIHPPLNGSLTKNLFKSFQCAKLLDRRISVDPIRLRVARILLFLYFERLCQEAQENTKILSFRSQGRDTASVVTDLLVEEIYHREKLSNQEERKQDRRSLQKQKQIGKRWSTLISRVGPSFLLTCSPGLATQM